MPTNQLQPTAAAEGRGKKSGTTTCILTMASEDTTATVPKHEEGSLLHVVDVLEVVLGDIWTGSSNRKKISIVHHTEENPGGTMMSHDRAAPNVDTNVMHGHHHGSDGDSYDDTPNSRRHSSVSDGEEAEYMSVDAEENDGEQHGQYHQTYALRQQLEDLASVDPEALRRQLHPVLEALDKLDAEATLGLERTNESWMGPVRLDDTVQVVPIHELITPRQYGQMAGCVRYLHITERQNLYSIGIFLFPPSARIPLHDHPNMAVLSRVLYGEVTARSFDLIPQSPTCKDDAVTKKYGDEPDHCDQNPTANNTDSTMNDTQENNTNSSSSSTLSRSMLGRTGSWISSLLRRSSSALSASVSSVTSSDPKSRPRGSKRARMSNSDLALKAPATTMLLPREGNVHQFTAGPDGAAVLDVLLPPYDFDNERDCTFYKVEPDTSASASTRKNEDDRGNDNCWLIPIEQPNDFHCISGTFGSVGVTE